MKFDYFLTLTWYIRNDPDKFGTNIESVRNLEKILLKLEKTVVESNMFETVIGVKSNVGKSLIDEMTNFIRTLSTEVGQNN